MSQSDPHPHTGGPHDEDHAHDEHHSPEAILKNMSRCWNVLYGLIALTVLTVLVAYMPFDTTGHLAIALLIATGKAALVALFFMHLISEKVTIYQFMAFTAFFAFGLFFLTYLAWIDPIPALYGR
jgi:caa(3)-type oxidase subunit IV